MKTIKYLYIYSTYVYIKNEKATTLELQTLNHFLSLDLDGDSRIDIGEFKKYLGDRKEDQKSLDEIFASLDKDGDGFIDAGEFDRDLDDVVQSGGGAEIKRDEM